MADAGKSSGKKLGPIEHFGVDRFLQVANLGGRKIGGLLAESSADLLVVGLGLNLWWPDAPIGTGALYGEDPGPDAVGIHADRWAEALLARVDRGPDRWGIEEYRTACSTIGRHVSWKPDGSGQAVAVDDDGRLLVRTDGGLVALASGEVREVR